MADETLHDGAGPDGPAPSVPGTVRRPEGTPRRAGGWRRWRRARPFWGGVLITLGSLEILASVRAPLPVLLHVGMQGLATYLVPLVLLTCGLLLLFNPAQRVFYSILAIILSLVSWLTSNLGGFLIGMLLGLVGGALAFAWTPHRPPKSAGRAAAPTEPVTEPTTGRATEPVAGPATDLATGRATEPAGVPPADRAGDG